MRTLNRYLTQDYLVIFGMTLLVFTFVMCLGAVIKAIDLGARGVSGFLILKVFSYNIPYMLMFSIPISVLTGVLLLWVWFLFFLPGDPPARSAHRPAVGAVADDPAATAPTTADPPAAPSTADGPAFIDDPADQGRESATGTTETARGPGPAR